MSELERLRQELQYAREFIAALPESERTLLREAYEAEVRRGYIRAGSESSVSATESSSDANAPTGPRRAWPGCAPPRRDLRAANVIADDEREAARRELAEGMAILADNNESQLRREEVAMGLAYCVRQILDRWQGASDDEDKSRQRAEAAEAQAAEKERLLQDAWRQYHEMKCEKEELASTLVTSRELCDELRKSLREAQEKLSALLQLYGASAWRR